MDHPMMMLDHEHITLFLPEGDMGLIQDCRDMNALLMECSYRDSFMSLHIDKNNKGHFEVMRWNDYKEVIIWTTQDSSLSLWGVYPAKVWAN
jgi:hypothetical protein